MASSRMIDETALAGPVATGAGLCLIFAASLSFADTFWAKNDSSWCLKDKVRSTCLPSGSEPSKITASEVIFELSEDEFQPPVVISSTSDQRAKGAAYALDEREAEILYSSKEYDVETTVSKALDLYFVEFRLAQNANLRVAGFELDQVEKIASDVIRGWTSTQSSSQQEPERCKRYFHAGCAQN